MIGEPNSFSAPTNLSFIYHHVSDLARKLNKTKERKYKSRTFSKEEAKRLERPNANLNALPVKGNLSSAFTRISLRRAGSFTDTKSCMGPNHSLMTGPYFLWESYNISAEQKSLVISEEIFVDIRDHISLVYHLSDIGVKKLNKIYYWYKQVEADHDSHS